VITYRSSRLDRVHCLKRDIGHASHVAGFMPRPVSCVQMTELQRNQALPAMGELVCTRAFQVAFCMIAKCILRYSAWEIVRERAIGGWSGAYTEKVRGESAGRIFNPWSARRATGRRQGCSRCAAACHRGCAGCGRDRSTGKPRRSDTRAHSTRRHSWRTPGSR